MERRQVIKLGTWVAVLLALFILFLKLFETVSASEILIVQYPNGKLEVYNTPGVKFQGFGTLTSYKKSFQYSFDKEDEKAIQVRFNDGGHGALSGSCRIDLPLDAASMITLHTKYQSQEGIERALVRTVLDKSVYFTGTLMSSKESSNSRRNDLITYIADQAEYGVYRTLQKEVKNREEGMDSNKIVTVVIILKDSTGRPLRQEISPFSSYRIAFSNLSINHLDYDSAIETQIRKQQELTMQVQTAMAQAKTAEQQLYTTQKQGEANAVAAKWEQEKEKATEVTKAEQYLAVQKLATEKAAAYKQEQILIGEGDAERKRLAMQANGALDAKLEAWIKSQQYMWDAFSKFGGNLVPLYQTGSGSTNNNALDYLQIMGMKAARDLNLDMSTKK